MSGNSKAVPFHGILAMGNTKDEAVNRYRLLALGKGVSAMKDAGGTLAFVTHASNKIAELFNPQSGELDLAKDESLLSKMDFQAQAGEVEANHYVCESGCGLHLVYDSEELVKICPSCTTAIASDDDEDEDDVEESDDDSEDEDADAEEDDEDDTSESADDEDEDEDGDEDDEEDIEDSGDDEDDSDEDDEDDSDSDDEEDADDADEDDDDSEEDEDDSDDEEDEDDSGEPLVIAADSKEKAIEIYQANRQGIATAATTVEVEYKVCTSSDCNAHILSEDASLSSCPACNSEIKEPEPVVDPAAAAPATAPVAEASDDDEDDEDEDDDLKVVDDDEDEDEDDEDDTSESKQTPAVAETQPENNMNVETVTVNMLSQLNDTAEDAHKGLDVSFSANVAGTPLWTAFFNGTPVATASKNDAGKNADIFTDVAFGQAVIAGARHVGVKETLNEMGFKGIAHDISIASVVTDKVNEQVAIAKAGLDRDRLEHADRLMAALATAAIGINRGFFQDIANPVKAALWNVMSSAGVKNAEALIDNAFRTSNEDYHRSLFAKASDITSQPLEVQESLSKAVLGTNYMNASTASANPAGTFEDRLELGSATASAKEEVQTKPNKESLSNDDGGERMSRAIAGLGRRTPS